MSITLDKILNVSLNEFMEYGNNSLKYADYDILGVNLITPNIDYIIIHNFSRLVPEAAELVVNLKTAYFEERKDYDNERIFMSGLALVPPNNTPPELSAPNKLLNISLAEFMNFGNNHQKYSDYSLIGITDRTYFRNFNFGNNCDYLVRHIPRESIRVVNFDLKNTRDNGFIISGTALVPKPNDGGSNVNN